uniref:Uncharacterized protein n=1 Tax=Parascaris univalens TaxID=6257 RepID=A0A915BVB6_PARUN
MPYFAFSGTRFGKLLATGTSGRKSSDRCCSSPFTNV